MEKQITTEQLLAYLARPVETEDELNDDVSSFRIPVFQNFLKHCHGQPTDRLNTILSQIAPAILSTDAYKASQLAMVCGVLVEWGAEAEIAVAQCIERFKVMVPALRNFLQKRTTTFEAAPEAVKARYGANFMLQALMTMLSRSLKFRQILRTDRQFVKESHDLEEIDSFRQIGNLNYLNRLLDMIDDECLTVIFPELGRGLEVRVEAIQNNAHLLTLLQAEILNQTTALKLTREYPPPDPNLLAFAQGNDYNPTLLDNFNSALFGYYDVMAYALSETLDNVSHRHFIYPEQPVAAIPAFNGRRIMLLKENPATARSWALNLFSPLHEALHSKVEVTAVLSNQEVSQVLAAIKKVEVTDKLNDQEDNRLSGLQSATKAT